MDLISSNAKTLIYVQSEAEFNRAVKRGVWNNFYRSITRQQTFLRSFDEATKGVCLGRPINQGVQDIPLEKIAGSVERVHDFTPQFLPRLGHGNERERWRGIYTLAVSGKGFPPVKLYKINEDYFVEDGHHRISVAVYLGWSSIQAFVLEFRGPRWPISFN